ncbi:MAG: polysaccharide biosynthesis protein [Candidatus Acidiferrales bacterium]
MSFVNSGKTVLLTGAGGWIGSALAKALIAANPRLLILIDHSEQNLHQIQSELAAIPNCAPTVAILGDICDGPLLAELFQTHGPQIIYHAAAFKHVPLMEANAIAAVRNNAIGTARLAEVAHRNETEKLILISTDKAVNPCSVMGVSKRVAELALGRWATGRCEMKAVRLGNVLASHGSVVPLFLEQISRGGPVTVTHPDVSRYFLTLNEAVDLVLSAADIDNGNCIYIPELGEPIKILDLARQLILHAGREPEKEIPIVFVGLRPGDKMTEELAFASETIGPTVDARLLRVPNNRVVPEEFDPAISELEGNVRRRDVAALTQTLRCMVPEYQPGERISGLFNRATA